MLVDDAASAIVSAMRSFESLDNHGIYNVCTGVASSIRQVGEMIAEEMASPKTLLEWGALHRAMANRIASSGTLHASWQPQSGSPSMT